MSAYDAAQARLADAKRRRDTRSEHAAVEESKRLMTQQLRAEMTLRRAVGRRGLWPVLSWWRRVA